jgi:hypothetical protein
VANPQIPYMFRGQSRFYRVVGVQDHTFYGLNVEVNISRRSKLEMTVALACLNPPPENTPFTIRAVQPFLVGMEEFPPDGTKPLVVMGARLDKFNFVLGEGLSSFQCSDHLAEQVPVLSAWLDQTLENAGIMPAFNDTAEIFQYFFGKTSEDGGVVFPLELPEIKGTAENDPKKFDFSKYGLPPPDEHDSQYVHNAGSAQGGDYKAVLALKTPKPKYDAPPATMPGEQPGKPAPGSQETTDAYSEYTILQHDEGEPVDSFDDWYADWNGINNDGND